MVITISGLSGSGKSTAARILAERLGITAIDVGKIFRAMAAKHGMDVSTFGAYAEKHPEVDRQFDEAMIEKVRKSTKGVVLQGRLAGWMTLRHKVPAFRIWLAAKSRTRAQRITGREKAKYSKILKQTLHRDRMNRVRYIKTYGLDLNDTSIYDSVVQTDTLSADEVVDVIIGHIEKVWRKKRPQPKHKKRPRPTKPKKRSSRK
jgi:cytidylate kinase